VSAINIAEQRRATEVKRISLQIAAMHAEARRGANGANGVTSSHLVEHQRWLESEASRLEAVIADLSALSADELVERYVPEAKPVEGVTLDDAFPQKGAKGPRQVVVSRQAPPSHQTGTAGLAAPESAPAGFIPGQVHTPNYSMYDR
jgi:hypothetical protein